MTCSIRDPNAGIRKVPLANETQNKLKTRVSNEIILLQGQLLLQHILETRQSTKQHQNFSTMRIKCLQDKSVFSGINLFHIQMGRKEWGEITKMEKKNPVLFQHIFSAISQNFNPNLLSFKEKESESSYRVVKDYISSISYLKAFSLFLSFCSKIMSHESRLLNSSAYFYFFLKVFFSYFELLT